MKTAWIHVPTRYRIEHPIHLKVSASHEAAHEWFETNDPEGVAFEYE